MVSNCIIWWQRKNILAGYEESCGTHDSSYEVGFLFVRLHIIQFDWILVCLVLFYKKCQTLDLLISVPYIAAKPKRIKMMLPTNFLGQIFLLRGDGWCLILKVRKNLTFIYWQAVWKWQQVISICQQYWNLENRQVLESGHCMLLLVFF